jgi:hypothetical protein
MLCPATRPFADRGVPQHFHRRLVVRSAAHLGDVAGGEHALRARAQVRIRLHASAARQPRRLGEIDLRLYADRHRDEVAGDALAIPRLHRTDMARRAEDGRHLGERVDLDAAAAQPILDDARFRLGQHVAPVAVLTHQVVDAHASPRQSLGDLERGYAAADDGGGTCASGPTDEVVRIVEIVELDHTVEVVALHAEGHGLGPRREQKAVELESPAAAERHGVTGGVDRDDPFDDVTKAEASRLGGCGREEDPFGDLSREVVREPRPRVVPGRLPADDRHVRRRLEADDLLGGGHRRGARPDEHVAPHRVTTPLGTSCRGRT